MDQDKSLYRLLEDYAASGALPMHMPGHKRNPLAPYLQGLGARLDLTEIDGFDDLHCPQGILREAQARAAALWGADESYFLVNGSSGGLLAAVYAATRPGDQILLARNSHKSLFHAVELRGLVPRFLTPPLLPGLSCPGSLSPEAAAAALDRFPGVKLAVVTSPTYEGVLSDVAGIAQACHRRGIPLLVDEAHGAHLGLGGGFPEGAVKAGADLVVQSLHKTLPSLTQTAILHRNGDLVDPQRLRHALAVFQTSSPSYLLMASLDGCVSLLKERPELLENWRRSLDSFYESAGSLRQIALLPQNLPGVFDRDPGKLLLSAPEVPGPMISAALRERFQIELEMAAPGYALAMTGPGDTPASLNRLLSALRELDGSLAPLPSFQPEPFYPPSPQLELPPGQAMGAPSRFVPLSKAQGMVAAEYIWAYPPGIPAVIPGERISPELARRAQDIRGLRSTSGRLPEAAVLL